MTGADGHPDDGDDVGGDVARVIVALEAAASGRREALAGADAETARERARADLLVHQVRAAEANVQELLARAERAQAEAQAARQEAAAVTDERDRLQAELEQVTASAQASQGRADALQQEIDAVKAASLPRRVWRAIRRGGVAVLVVILCCNAAAAVDYRLTSTPLHGLTEPPQSRIF
jgi:hypothetical protein